jgi:peptide/nickel transport system substrate-binding protein
MPAKKSLLRFLTFFCLCLVLVVSCSRSAPELSQPKTAADRIVVGTTAIVSTLDPADAYSIFGGMLLYNLGDRLYTYQLGSDRLEPQLAMALPNVSPDGLTYKIPLRQGVTFHDGEPFNAEAMAFSLNRFIQNAGGPSFLLSDLVDSVKATAAYELTIKLKKPFAAFPSLLAFSGACAVSPKAYEIKEGAFKPETFVGTGPYKLVKFGTDSIQLQAFEQYWGSKPANRGVDIQFFSSPANLFNGFRTGAVDLAYQSLGIDQVSTLLEGAPTAGWQVIEKSGSDLDYLTLNVKTPPLDQVEVRQAIAALIDRPLLQQRVFLGQVDLLYSLVPTTLAEHKPVLQQQYGDANIAKATELLTKAGYSPSNPLKLEVWYPSNRVNPQLAVITLKASARKKLGGLVQFDLRGVESVVINKNAEKGGYPITIQNWAADFLDADNYIQPFIECSKGSAKTGCESGSSYLQGSFYFSDRANQLIDRSRKELNPATRKQLFFEIQDLLAQEVPFIPLWQNKDYLFAQKWLQGASLQVTQKVPFWTIQKS